MRREPLARRPRRISSREPGTSGNLPTQNRQKPDRQQTARFTPQQEANAPPNRTSTIETAVSTPKYQLWNLPTRNRQIPERQQTARFTPQQEANAPPNRTSTIETAVSTPKYQFW